MCYDNNIYIHALENKYNIILNNKYQNNIRIPNPEYFVSTTFHLSWERGAIMKDRKINSNTYFKFNHIKLISEIKKERES